MSNFDTTNKEFRTHWNMGREAARNAAVKLNELVRILKNENPDWTISKIANQIWLKNEELDGFTRKTIYNNLDDENRQLIDNRFQKGNNVLEESDVTLHPNVIEESSIPTEPEISDDEANEILKELPEPTEELQEEVIYDKGLLNKHVKEISKLQEENAQLKIDRIPTRANKYDFEYEMEFSEEMFLLIKANSWICPFTITVFPDKADGYPRFNRDKIERSIKEANKKK